MGVSKLSKQTTFTLTLLMGVSVIVPGCAGYLSARMEAVEQARRELVSLESRILRERLSVPPSAETEQGRGQTIAVPGAVPCDIPPRPATRRGKEAVAAGLIPVPADLLPAGSARAEARQQRRAEQERRTEQERRRRQRTERPGIPGQEPTAGESPPSPSTSRRAPGGGEAAGSTRTGQADLPANWRLR
ncbi:hypothetical protein GCM10017673_52190 [Streptosporangium violaceochromogenes]|nr:hypothetical protein GCM10017673_52190 [Streptosporangium violaceochromogenes]